MGKMFKWSDYAVWQKVQCNLAVIEEKEGNNFMQLVYALTQISCESKVEIEKKKREKRALLWAVHDIKQPLILCKCLF